MPLNFPDSPSLNEIYTSGSNSWQWDGTVWNAISSSIIGIDGTNGVQGATGATGATGPQGIQGPTGPQGTVSTAFVIAMATAL
jgi:hypothetical protein